MTYPFQGSLFRPRPPWAPDALAAIRRHGALLPHQVAALVGDGEDRVADGLAALRDDGLLASMRVAPFRRNGGGEAFALAAAGLLALQRAGLAPPGRLPRRARGSHALAHDLERNELGVALELLDARGALALERWTTARSALGFAAHLARRGALLRVPLVADAFAVVRRGGHADALLVETDMGSVQVERMREKYAGYLAWWRAGGPAGRFGLRSLRVLTLAPTPERLRRLAEAARDAAPGGGLGVLWFGLLAQADCRAPGRLLEDAWLRADRPGERAALWA